MGIKNNPDFENLPDLDPQEPRRGAFQDCPWLWGETWNIGVLAYPLARLMSEPDLMNGVQWLFQKSTTDYYSDPCLIEAGSQKFLFYELFNRKSGKGVICCATLNRNTHGWHLENPQVILDEPFHVSHPFVFQHDEKWYMIPEAADSGNIVVYETPDFPFRWKPGKILISGFKGIDPVVVRHGGLWWLFCGENSCNHNANLHAFHAPSLFGPWSPHSANPVVQGPGESRPAGKPFLDSGKLIRPAQDCRFTYGQNIVFREIDRLTPTDFHETGLGELTPMVDSTYPHGLHSITQAGGICIIDGKAFSGLKRFFGPGLTSLKKARYQWIGK